MSFRQSGCLKAAIRYLPLAMLPAASASTDGLTCWDRKGLPHVCYPLKRMQPGESKSPYAVCLFTTPFVWGECPSKVKTTSPVSTLNKSRRCLLFVPTFRPFRFTPRWKRFRKKSKVRIHNFLLDLDKSELRSVYTSLIVASKTGFFIVDICKTSHPFPSK